MASIVTNGFRLQNLLAVQEAITDTSNNSFYLCIAKPTAWADEANPDAPVDSPAAYAKIWDEAMAGKRVIGTNTRQGIILRQWTSGQFYDMYRPDYDGTIAGVSLVGGATTPASLFDANYFVVDPTTLNVYKCLYNRDHTTNLPVASTDGSFLTDTSSNVVVGSDGYYWKYMFTVPSGDAALFDTPSFIPASVTGTAALVDGGIYAIVVTTAGAYTVAPTVVIHGDGTGAAATAHLGGGGVVYISISNPGSGYTHAKISFTGGTGAGGTVAEAIIGPLGGHGSRPADELGGIYLLIQTKLQADEAASGSKFTVSTSFRQLALLKNPTLSATLVTSTTIAMNRKLAFAGALTPANSFAPGDTITGGTSGAKGIVVDYNATTHVCRYIIDYTNTGDIVAFQNGEVVSNGTNSGTLNNPNGVVAADVDAYTGEIIYFENRRAIARSADQTEDVRLVLEF